MADYDFDNATSPLKTAGYPQDLTGLRAYLNAQAGVRDGNNPASPATAPSVPSTSRVAPSPSGTAPAPSPTPAPPAAVSPSGQPTADYFRQGMEGQLRNAQAAEKTVASMPTTDTASAAIQDKYSKVATPINPYDPQGKVLPEYRPSVGQRVLRGVRSFAQHGVLGPLGANYGAPNSEYQHEEAARQMQEKGLGGQLAASRAAFKESSDRLTAISKEQRDASTSYKDVTSGQTAEEAAQNKGTEETAKAELELYKASGGGAKAPTTAEGFVVANAAKMFPDDPQKQYEYVKTHQFVDANTDARVKEAYARLAEVQGNAAANRDQRQQNNVNNAFQRYQMELLTHGSRKSALDTKTQGEWSKFQDDYDTELYGKIDPTSGERTGGVSDKKDGDPAKQRVVSKYEQRRKDLVQNTDNAYKSLKEPEMPPILQGGSSAAPEIGR